MRLGEWRLLRDWLLEGLIRDPSCEVGVMMAIWDLPV